jgi:hypothetical protein
MLIMGCKVKDGNLSIDQDAAAQHTSARWFSRAWRPMSGGLPGFCHEMLAPARGLR